MANSNELIVKVLGDTSRLKKELASAEAQIKGFSTRTSSIRSTGADKLLASVRGMQAETDALRARTVEAEAQQARLNGSMARTGAGAVAAGIAVNVLGRNMQELGGRAGVVGSAFNELSTGNLVGFVQALQKPTDDLKALQAQLVAAGSAATATDLANKAASIGYKELAAAAEAAAKGIRATTDAFVDNTKIRDSTSPGAIAGQVSGVASAEDGGGKRKGITASQRNLFFDNDLARQLDRVQDSDLRGQVVKLNEIAATIQKRIDVTKDITRKRTLEDQLVAVNRQRKGVEAAIAQNAATQAAEKRLRQQLASEKRLADLTSRQFRQLGLAADGNAVTPGVDNLKKRVAQLTSNVAGTKFDTPRLQSQLKRFRTVLSEGLVPKDVREKLADLLDGLSQDFKEFQDRIGKQGPLTKTSQLNANSILAGLGLSPEDERRARARLSQFNSGGKGLSAGAGSVGVLGQPIVVQAPDVYLDGAKISSNSRKHDTIHSRRNPKQKRGRPF